MDDYYTGNNQNNLNPQYSQDTQNTRYNASNPNVQYNSDAQNNQYNANAQFNANGQYNSNAQYNANAQYNPNAQNNPNLQNLMNQQKTPFVAGAPSANDDDKDPLKDAETSWKVAIGLGVINIVLSILCGSFRVRIISAWLIILLLAGVYGSFMAIKGGIKTGKPLIMIIGIIAMVINVAATGYYIWSIIYTIGSKFS